MTKVLANIRISRKLGLLVAASIAQLLCLAGVGWWGLRLVKDDLDASQAEGRRMFLAGRIATDVNAVAVDIAGAVSDKKLGSERDARILELRKEYLGDFEELARLSASAEGKRRREILAQVCARWRESNIQVTKALQSGNVAVALKLYHQQVEPNRLALRAAVTDYMAYRIERAEVIEKHEEASLSSAKTMLIGFGALWLVVSALLGVLITRGVVKPLDLTVDRLGKVAEGNVSVTIPDEYLQRRDEIGSLAKAVQSMCTSLREVMKNITSNIHVVSSSATELSSNSGQMSDSSKKASEQAHTVAAAAEEMSANVMTVASGMEQTSTNLSHVASHTEQMTATIGEIATNSEKARRITEDATRQAARITGQMNELGQAAREIGKVTETITEISSQTNLLALNAAIEAARAGAAGKGFAVVANEIKELAQQTAAATEDIKNRIGSVQTSTVAGISEIDKVSHVIHEVSEIVSTIAAAIEEQATVTKDISRNIAEASTGVRDANLRVAEASEATSQIAKEIVAVDRTAGQWAEGSDQVRMSANDLSRVAEELRVTVSRFHA